VTSYRDKIDVIASILDIANDNEVSQAKILNKANISHNLFKEYLSFLRQYGLIEIGYTQSQMTYKTTANRIDYLGIFNKIRDLCQTPPPMNI
jgi:predicted transcriptional regulator